MSFLINLTWQRYINQSKAASICVYFAPLNVSNSSNIRIKQINSVFRVLTLFRAQPRSLLHDRTSFEHPDNNFCMLPPRFACTTSIEQIGSAFRVFSLFWTQRRSPFHDRASFEHTDGNSCMCPPQFACTTSIKQIGSAFRILSMFWTQRHSPFVKLTSFE